MKTAPFICLGLMLLGMPAAASEGFPKIRFQGLLDVRTAAADDTVSWLDGGLGKTRYGGSGDGDGRFIGRLAEASLIALPQFSWALSGHFHIKFDKDQHSPVDIVDAYLNYRSPMTAGGYRFSTRLGAFFPPISIENHGLAWTSTFGLTPSAINAWVGEELRTIGAEATLQKATGDYRFDIRGSLFFANDATGALLAWRGWALHDVTTTLFDRVPLAPIRAIDPMNTFRRHAPYLKPFEEIDGKFGYYVSTSAEHLSYGKLAVLAYDNRANPQKFGGTEYAWRTRFVNISLDLYLPAGVELLAQYMTGDTRMGPNPILNLSVDADFEAFYALLSKGIGNHRLSVRYDDFSVTDRDTNPYDNNNETGHAWTAAYMLEFLEHHRIAVEFLRVRSNRGERAFIGLTPQKTEKLFQSSYRFSF